MRIMFLSLFPFSSTNQSTRVTCAVNQSPLWQKCFQTGLGWLQRCQRGNCRSCWEVALPPAHIHTLSWAWGAANTHFQDCLFILLAAGNSSGVLPPSVCLPECRLFLLFWSKEYWRKGHLQLLHCLQSADPLKIQFANLFFIVNQYGECL